MSFGQVKHTDLGPTSAAASTDQLWNWRLQGCATSPFPPTQQWGLRDIFELECPCPCLFSKAPNNFGSS